MRKLLALILLTVSGLAGAANFTTQRYAVNYTIQKDRLVDVTETIEITFTAPSRGITRTIPFRTRSSSGKYRQVDLHLVGIESDFGSGFHGEPAKAEEKGGNWRIRVGDPDVTHSGKATYRIRYTIRGALTDIDKTDQMGKRTELYWHVIPADWSTAIDRAEGTLSFPEPGPGDVAARMLIGSTGSRRGVEIHLDGRVVGGNPALKAEFVDRTNLRFWVQTPIQAEVGVVAVVGLPAGTVDTAPSAPEVPVTDEQGNPYNPGSTSGNESYEFKSPIPPSNPLGYLLPVVLLPLIYVLARPRFAPPTGPLTVRFEPPDGVGASQAGLLIDGKVDSRDIIAGIIALAQKGAARLRHEGGQAAGVTVELLPFSNSQNTTIFEQQLYAGLEPFGRVITPEMLRGTFYPTYQALEQQLYAESLQKGWYRSHGQSGCGAGCLLAIAMLCVSGTLIPVFGMASFGGAVITAIGGWIILAKMSNLLQLGAKLRAQCLGLREFITRANEKELNYMANRMPDQAMFEELLPFAVAFDAVQQWTKAFEGLNLQPPDWYYGYDGYGADYLWTSLLLNDMMYFDRSYSDAVSAPPVSSYGGGGGFSDGDSGFGGGFSGGDSGGSSWDSGGSFDSGGSVGDAGGGGGGDSW